MPNTTDEVFDRVAVDYAMLGGARISWRLHRRYSLPETHTFQLQVGATGNPEATDWEDVGASFSNAFYAVDDERREFGRNLTPHYRVVLTTDAATHYSTPASAYGVLPYRDWLIVREIIRKETLMYAKYTGVEGMLLKRKRSGTTPDPMAKNPSIDDRPITDPMTGEIIHSGATASVGTEYLGGYYDPVPFLFSLSQEIRYEKRDDKSTMGTINPMEQKGRCPAFPQLNHEDVLVDIQSDRRYFVHKVEHAGQYRNVPVVVTCDLRLAESGHVIYTHPVENISNVNW
jgi:hypothetical protein